MSLDGVSYKPPHNPAYAVYLNFKTRVGTLFRGSSVTVEDERAIKLKRNSVEQGCAQNNVKITALQLIEITNPECKNKLEIFIEELQQAKKDSIKGNQKISIALGVTYTEKEDIKQNIKSKIYDLRSTKELMLKNINNIFGGKLFGYLDEFDIAMNSLTDAEDFLEKLNGGLDRYIILEKRAEKLIPEAKKILEAFSDAVADARTFGGKHLAAGTKESATKIKEQFDGHLKTVTAASRDYKKFCSSKRFQQVLNFHKELQDLKSKLNMADKAKNKIEGALKTERSAILSF